jgi:hypothetical protein
LPSMTFLKTRAEIESRQAVSFILQLRIRCSIVQTIQVVQAVRNRGACFALPDKT